MAVEKVQHVFILARTTLKHFHLSLTRTQLNLSILTLINVLEINK